MKGVYIVFESNGTESMVQGVFENERDAFALCERMGKECDYLNYYVEYHNVM